MAHAKPLEEINGANLEGAPFGGNGSKLNLWVERVCPTTKPTKNHEKLKYRTIRWSNHLKLSGSGPLPEKCWSQGGTAPAQHRKHKTGDSSLWGGLRSDTVGRLEAERSRTPGMGRSRA